MKNVKSTPNGPQKSLYKKIHLLDDIDEMSFTEKSPSAVFGGGSSEQVA